MRAAISKFRMMRTKVLAVIAIAVLAATMLGWQTDTRARYNKLGHELMCECGCGQILLECNHVGCTMSDKMAKQLRARLDQGMNDEQIKQAFIQEYGVVVLAAPTGKGFDIVAWIMPFVVLVLGIGVVTWFVKKWNSRAPLAVPVASGTAQEMNEMRRRAREETEI